MSISLSRGLILGLGHGVRLRRGGGGVSPEFLLRDDFTTAAAAPLASPRAAEPGPGTLTIVDTGSKLSISGGALVVAGGKASPAYGDPGIFSAAIAAATGRALLVKVNLSTIGFAQVGWDDNAAGALSNLRLRISAGDGGRVDYLSDTSTLGAFAANTDYQLGFVQRSTGGLIVIKGGAYTDWALLWVGNTETWTNQYAGVANYNSVGTLDTFRVADLLGPWADDYGIATDRLSGARSAGDTYSHEANHLVEWTQTTVPSADYTDMYLRRVDASNGIVVSTASDGSISLYELSGGTWTLLGSVSAATVANGHRFVVACSGTTIRVYSNNALRITGTSSVGQAATAGRLDALGTGGAVSNIVAWPRTINGAAKQWLDAAIAD